VVTDFEGDAGAHAKRRGRGDGKGIHVLFGDVTINRDKSGAVANIVHSIT
jgi:hypothetical protein